MYHVMPGQSNYDDEQYSVVGGAGSSIRGAAGSMRRADGQQSDGSAYWN